MKLLWPLAAIPIALLVFGPAGCSTPTDGKVNAATLDATSFPPVSEMLLVRCGSVDCHGSRYRNFRLVGFGASRLAAGDRPDEPATTDAEHRYNYEGLVGLEPEKMAAVAAQKGANMSELTVVRKARGEEAHKGDARIAAGDDADLCLRSWFASAVDGAACKRAIDAR